MNVSKRLLAVLVVTLALGFTGCGMELPTCGTTLSDGGSSGRNHDCSPIDAGAHDAGTHDACDGGSDGGC